MDTEADRKLVTGLLEFVLSDMDAEEDVPKKHELVGLRLLPTASNGVGTFGSELLMANAEQQMLLPKLKA